MGDEVQTYDDFWDKSVADYKFCIRPRKCHFSKKILFMTGAYRLSRIVTGPGEPIVEDRWLSKEEFIIQKLKGTI